jgi:hypothetical protein
MFINTFEWQMLMATACGDLDDPWPEMKASGQVFIFEEEWLDDTFNPFWWDYVVRYREERNQPLENSAVRGTCDEISEHCGIQFATAMRKLVGDVDCRAGALYTKITIPGGYVLNDVPGPGGHQLLTVGTHKRVADPSKLTIDDVTLHAYESQNRQRTKLADAVARGIRVRDQWL